MTEHTRRQKGRNVAKLIRDGCPRVVSLEFWQVLSPLVVCYAHDRLTPPLHPPLENKPACGPRVYLRCAQPAGEKHYASVLLCDHPTYHPISRSIRDCGFEWSVFTHWHTRRVCYTLVTREEFLLVSCGWTRWHVIDNSIRIDVISVIRRQSGSTSEKKIR